MEKICPHCKKVIESLYESQLEYNYKLHVEACERKKNLLIEKGVEKNE